MISETDDTRLGRLEGQMELMVQAMQEVRQELRAVHGRIDRLTLAVLGMGGGVVVALISLVGVLAVQLIRNG